MQRLGSRLGFGIAAAALLLFAGEAAAGGFHPIFQFTGGADGSASIDQLQRDGAGNLYGITTGNDTNAGTVFTLSPGGTMSTLHTFVSGVDQSTRPTGGVVRDAAGNLYGEAVNGGAINCNVGTAVDPNCGSVYKLAPDGTLTTLYAFQGGADGGMPLGGLLLDKQGNLYGTTLLGGSSNFCTNSCGTVFKIAPDGTETVLHAFLGKEDGEHPSGNLIADKAGNLYGTTDQGGYGNGYFWGYGTVFKLAPNGTETVLHAFQGGTDGSLPEGGLVRDAAGNLYGTTRVGGSVAGQGAGTVYKLAPDGTHTVLHAFGSVAADGLSPSAQVLIDKKGDLYGTTLLGGKGCHLYGCGTVFKVAADGTYSRVYTLLQKVAHSPAGGLVADAKGNLYGNATAAWDVPGNPGILFTVRK